MSAKKNILLAAGGAAAGLALAQGVILGAHGIGPLKKLQPLRLSRMPGNQENFSLSTVRAAEPNALTGKYLCFLGSSVTKGAASLDVSFAEYLAVRNRCPYKKEAVNGTTIADVVPVQEGGGERHHHRGCGEGFLRQPHVLEPLAGG